jgi:DNA-binding MarR family transcriptional regulator
MSPDSGTGKQLPEIDRLIHEPARYNIMALLYVISRAEFLFLQNQTNLTPGNLSAHVSKLDTGGYLKIEKEFAGKKPKTFLSLTESGREAFEDYRRRMKAVFADLPAVKDSDRTSSIE